MTSSPDPRAGDDDLTSKARIRNAALDLYAEFGEDRTSMRAIATAAGVTVGLVAHHFGNRDGVRDAVEQLVVDYIRHALAQVPTRGTTQEIATARDGAVEDMLRHNPTVVNYLRRVLLDPSGTSQMLRRMTDLTATEVVEVRAAVGSAAGPPRALQVIGIVVRQLGQLFLQPMLDAMWSHLEGPDAADEHKPVLTVGVHDPA